VQKLVEIKLSDTELWPTDYFQYGGCPPSLILKIPFLVVTVISFKICCPVPNYINIGRFFTKIWLYNVFQNGGRRQS